MEKDNEKHKNIFVVLFNNSGCWTDEEKDALRKIGSLKTVDFQNERYLYMYYKENLTEEAIRKVLGKKDFDYEVKEIPRKPGPHFCDPCI